MKRSSQKVPISKAPGEILIFPLGPLFILSLNEIFILLPASLAKEESTQSHL
jgi:hypothetical protein